MSAGKAVIGQSGGPTAVINKSLIGFIKEATTRDFDEILGARHGLAGMLGEDFVDLSNFLNHNYMELQKPQPQLLDQLEKNQQIMISSSLYLYLKGKI